MNIKETVNQLKLNIKKELGFKSFSIGIFFLASAPFLAFLFLIFPILAGLIKNYKYLIEDKLNYLLLLAALIMISKSIISLYLGANSIEGWDPY